jgi:peptidoglycan/LPS O-acetylase OafA/YrhL
MHVMRRLGHVPALDGLRGIAIGVVVGFHYFRQPPGGFAGVDLFFVLSGFLITTLLLEEHAEMGTVSLRRFYERRARRLLPAAWTVIMLCILLGYTAGGVTGLFYVANIQEAIRPPHGGPTSILWSLSMEEQFYLVWPLALLFLLRRKLPIGRILVVAVAAFTMYRVGWLLAGGSRARVYFAPDTHADPLIVGCLLAVLRHNGYWITSKLAILAAVPLLVFVVLEFRVETLASQSIGLTLTELAAVGLIVAAVNGSWLLSVAPLLWLGRISYSLYLWHPLAAHVFHASLVALAAAVLLAWLSYRYIETPFRRRRTPMPQPTPGATPAT